MRIRNVTLTLCLALVACGDDGTVADGAVAIPDNVVGDASATGLAAPANAAAAEAHADAVTPLITEGQRWIDRTTTNQVKLSFAAEHGPMLVLACPRTGASGLSVVRASAAPHSAMATMSFTGGGHVASLPMHDVEAGDNTRLWSGMASREDALAIGRTFEPGAPVEVTLGVTPKLVVPADPMVRRLLQHCAGA